MRTARAYILSSCSLSESAFSSLGASCSPEVARACLPWAGERDLLRLKLDERSASNLLRLYAVVGLRGERERDLPAAGLDRESGLYCQHAR